MSRVVELLCSRRVPQVAVLALMSVGFAGCSADMSTRLSQNSFSNPFASQPEATGSVPDARGRAPRASAIFPPADQPQYQSAALAAADLGAAILSGRAAPACPEEGAGVASYSPPAHPIETTGTVAPRSVAAAHGSVQGGTTIIVGTSDTLEILSRRYNVSSAAILQANGYKGPRALSPGQQLIIPHPAATVAARRPRLPRRSSKPVAVAAPRRRVHVVNHGDTLLSIARHNHVPVAELARANNLDPAAKLKLGMKLIVPAAKTAAAAPPLRAAAVAAAQPRCVAVPPATKVAAVDDPAESAPGPGRAERRGACGRIAGQGAKRPARCRPSVGRCAAR